jgi:hypothetical protein
MCGRDAENTDRVCACGYVFAGGLPSGAVASAAPVPALGGSKMDLVGWLLLGISVLWAFIIVNLPDNAPGSDVINLDLQHRHLMMGVVAAVLFISGVMLIIGAKISNAVRGA